MLEHVGRDGLQVSGGGKQRAGANQAGLSHREKHEPEHAEGGDSSDAEATLPRHK